MLLSKDRTRVCETGNQLPLTFAKLLKYQASRRPSFPAFRSKKLGIWKTWTWEESYESVKNYAIGFMELGIQRGESVVVACECDPSSYWVLLALNSIGAIPALIHSESNSDELAVYFRKIKPRVAIVQGQEQVDKIASSIIVEALSHIVFVEPQGLSEYEDKRLVDLASIASLCHKNHEDQNEDIFDREIDRGVPAEIAAILFTQGTCEAPKGVLVSNVSCLSVAARTVAQDKLQDVEEVVSAVSPAWIGDLYLHFAQALIAGFCISCPESHETLLDDLREIGPTYFAAPARLYIGLYRRVRAAVSDAGPLGKSLCSYFLTRGAEDRDTNKRGSVASKRVARAIGEAVIFGPLKNLLGLSKVKVAYVVGEALPAEISNFYRTLGIEVRVMYAASEGVVGQIETLNFRLADDGQVLFAHAHGSVSYLGGRSPILRIDGADYLASGDFGVSVESGRLTIIDRVENRCRLSSGHTFFPRELEPLLEEIPYVKQGVVIGHDRPYVAALLIADQEMVTRWAKGKAISFASFIELSQHPEVKRLIARELDAINQRLSRDSRTTALQIKAFTLLGKDFDVDEGELTRGYKIRRHQVAKRHAKAIDDMYDETTFTSTWAAAAALPVSFTREGVACDGGTA